MRRITLIEFRAGTWQVLSTSYQRFLTVWTQCNLSFAMYKVTPLTQDWLEFPLVQSSSYWVSLAQWSIEISCLSSNVPMTFSIEKCMTYIDCNMHRYSSFHLHSTYNSRARERKNHFILGLSLFTWRQVVFTYHLPSRNKCTVLFANSSLFFSITKHIWKNRLFIFPDFWLNKKTSQFIYQKPIDCKFLY